MEQHDKDLAPGRHELHFVSPGHIRDWPKYKAALERGIEDADPRVSVVSITLKEGNQVFVIVDVKG